MQWKINFHINTHSIYLIWSNLLFNGDKAPLPFKKNFLYYCAETHSYLICLMLNYGHC